MRVGSLVLAFGSALTLPLLGGCDRTETRVVDQFWSACVQPGEGERLEVDVVFAECLSSSCDDLISASCKLELDGDVVTVSGEALIESPAPRGRPTSCTTDCGSVTASCSLELPPGDYRLVGADEEFAFSHPVSEPAGSCEF